MRAIFLFVDSIYILGYNSYHILLFIGLSLSSIYLSGRRFYLINYAISLKCFLELLSSNKETNTKMTDIITGRRVEQEKQMHGLQIDNKQILLQPLLYYISTFNSKLASFSYTRKESTMYVAVSCTHSVLTMTLQYFLHER